MGKEDQKKIEEKKQEEAKKNLKKLIEKAKSGPNFGICLAKDSSQQPAIVFSGTKAVSALEKEAKAEAGGIKTGAGTLSMNGGKIYFNFQTDIPTGTLKAIKAHFSYAGLTAKVALVDKNNKIEDDEVQPTTGDQTARAEITLAFQKLAGGLIGLKTGLPNFKAQLDTLTEQMQEQLAAPTLDPNAARRVFGQLQQLDQAARNTPVSTGPTPQPDSGNKQPPERPQTENPGAVVTNAMKSALADIKEKASSDPALGKSVLLLTEAFKKAMTEQPPNLKSAQAIVQKIGELAKGSPEGNDEDKFVFAGTAWTKAMTEASKDLEKLKSKILDEAAGEPGIGKVETAFGKIAKTLDQLNLALSKVILQESKGKSGDEARSVADKAIKTADQVANILSRDPILSKIDDNPFEKTNVVGTLMESINKLRQDLAA